MIKLMQAENLKFKRAFSRKLIYLGPLIFAIYGICISFLIPQGNKYFVQLVFNWWSLIFMPLSIALMAVLAHVKERKVGNYRNFYVHHIDLIKMWVSRVGVIAIYTLLASFWLVVTVFVLNIFIGDQSVSAANIIKGAIVCWLVNLIFIPIYLYLAILVKEVMTLIISIVGIIVGVILATESVWTMIPWCWGLRMMCPIIGVHPNGTVLPEGSELLLGQGIEIIIVLAVILFAVITCLTGILFKYREG